LQDIASGNPWMAGTRQHKAGHDGRGWKFPKTTAIATRAANSLAKIRNVRYTYSQWRNRFALGWKAGEQRRGRGCLKRCAHNPDASREGRRSLIFFGRNPLKSSDSEK